MSRKALIALLENRPKSVHDIAAERGMRVKDVASDLEHLHKSLKHMPYKMQVEPARCHQCGFQFKPEKWLPPSKCPLCHGRWIEPALISIEAQ